MRKISIIIVCLFGILSCATRKTPAPIVNATAPIQNNKSAVLANKSAKAPVISSTTSDKPTISKVDDDTPLVVDNNVVTTAPTSSTAKPATKDAVIATPPATNATGINGGEWIMPTQGKITQQYTESSKGININGKEGQEIVAINAGKVVYSGNGLKGYGNLIIIKHNATYLSAYAHNKVNLVKEGDQVSRGQKIAEMGSTDSKSPMLHLEVRKNGKPINPETLIKP